MVVSTVLISSVELTAWLTSPSAFSSSTERARSRVRACTSSNRRTFSMAITAWSAKVVTSSICLSVKGCTLERVSVMTPTGVPSLRSGTPSMVRYPSSFETSRVYSSSSPMSWMWTVLRSSKVRPTHDPRSGSIERFCRYSLLPLVAWYIAATRYPGPLGSQMFTMSASHRRAADSTSVSSTGWISKVERLMTLRTSEVAVCCSSDAVSSRVRA